MEFRSFHIIQTSNSLNNSQVHLCPGTLLLGERVMETLKKKRQNRQQIDDSWSTCSLAAISSFLEVSAILAIIQLNFLFFEDNGQVNFHFSQQSFDQPVAQCNLCDIGTDNMVESLKKNSIELAHSCINHIFSLILESFNRLLSPNFSFQLFYISNVKMQRLEQQRLLSILKRIVKQRYLQQAQI